MPAGESDQERSGAVLRIAALLAALLALAAVIAPRVAFSRGDGPPDGGILPAVTLTPATPAAGTTTATLPITSTTAPNPVPGDGDSGSMPGAAEVEGTVATTDPPTAGGTVTEADGGEVTLALAGLHAGREGPRRASFLPDDRIGWHFRVVNTGDEYLWGLFVYLERYGPVACGVRRLDVGEAADCWAETWAQSGANTAEAWVTAWTTSRMVFGRASHRVLVAAS